VALCSAETEEEYKAQLHRDTITLNVETHSQTMFKEVRSVLALPILAADQKTVLAVLFADSTKFNVFADECIRTISKMCQDFVENIEAIQSERVHNFSIPSSKSKSGNERNEETSLEVIKTVPQTPPCATEAKYLNIEFTDFISQGKAAFND
jgi:hypothetical protein